MSALREVQRKSLEKLADALQGGRLVPPYTGGGLHGYVAQASAPGVASEFTEMAGEGMGPAHIARLLRVLVEERTAAQAVADRLELVWTGAEVAGTMSRDTFVVAQELFRQVRRHLLISSYNIDTGQKASAMFGDLARRMDNEQDLNVRLFLNVQRKMDDQRPGKVLLQEFAHRFRHQVWPGQRLPRVFHDPRSLDLEWTTRACLHAKCIVADDTRALVTSANLSEAAHERNIEAGLVIRDPHVARALRLQFEALVERGILLPVLGV